jgi:hypothetical protein
MTNNVTVKILHRFKCAEGGMPFFSEFSSGDQFAQVLRFTCGFPQCRHVEMLLKIIWEQLNIDEPRAEWALDYRARRNRSLSVGDVVVVGEQAFACDRVGWSPIRLDARQVFYDLGRMEKEGASNGDS